MDSLQNQIEISEAQSRLNFKQVAKQQALHIVQQMGIAGDAHTLISESQKIYEWLIKDI
jgi:hypothetical protein